MQLDWGINLGLILKNSLIVHIVLAQTYNEKRASKRKDYEQIRMVMIGGHSKIKNNSLLNGSYSNDYRSQPYGRGTIGLFSRQFGYFRKN